MIQEVEIKNCAKKEGEYIPLNVKLPKELVEMLDEYSDKTRIPKTGVTELALTEYLEKHDIQD